MPRTPPTALDQHTDVLGDLNEAVMENGSALKSVVMGIGDGRKRQHRNSAIDRIGAARSLGDRAHLLRDRRAII